jgi:hypothetical protein
MKKQYNALPCVDALISSRIERHPLFIFVIIITDSFEPHIVPHN